VSYVNSASRLSSRAAENNSFGRDWLRLKLLKEFREGGADFAEKKGFGHAIDLSPRSGQLNMSAVTCYRFGRSDLSRPDEKLRRNYGDQSPYTKAATSRRTPKLK